MCLKYLVDILTEIGIWCIKIDRPTLLSATVDGGDIVLVWEDNSDNETGFSIERNDGTGWVVIDTVGANETTYTDSTGVIGTTYSYRVEAYNTSDTSAYSNTATATIVLTTIKYGALYNWYAATDARLICSAGWHTPTANEALTLRNYLDPINNDQFTNVAGGLMKETGLTYWSNPNTGATNSAGFNGRGSGVRTNLGVFSGLDIAMYLWNTRDDSPTQGGVGTLQNDLVNFSQALNSVTFKTYGCSIRPFADSTTLLDGEEGTYTGNDGKIYRTICIGTQEWVADNLWETKFRNGDDITVVTDAVAWAALATEGMCYYNNDISNA